MDTRAYLHMPTGCKVRPKQLLRFQLGLLPCAGCSEGICTCTRQSMLVCGTCNACGVHGLPYQLSAMRDWHSVFCSVHQLLGQPLRKSAWDSCVVMRVLMEHLERTPLL